MKIMNEEWVDIYSQRIAPLHTKTAAPKKKDPTTVSTHALPNEKKKKPPKKRKIKKKNTNQSEFSEFD